MADIYDPDLVEGDQDDDSLNREGYTPFRENVVFLVDAQAAMTQTAELDDAEFKDLTWLEVAIKIAREVLKARIISSDNDQLAIIFYGTRETNNLNAFDGIYTYMDLDVPDAQRIRELDKLLGGGFDTKIGSSAAKSPDHLRYALWTASQLLAGGSAKASKRIMMFTNDDNPVGTGEHAGSYRDQILSRAHDLHDTAVALELYPLVPAARPFGMAFWRELLGVEGDAALAEYEGEAKVNRLRDLATLLRAKAFKKRTLGSLRWMFPGGLEMAVKMFAMYQPAVKGTAQTLEARSNEPLRVETAYICDDTGAVLTDIPRAIFPSYKDAKLKNAVRFPKIILHQDELRELKQVRSPGLRLLGFKPRAALREHHQLRNSTFLYPDESSMVGSTTAFIAFHQQMINQDKIAICSFVRNRAAEPRLVALIAAAELVNSDSEQVEPPGMHMIYLPFADDIRSPETDPSFIGTGFQVATPEQVASATALLNRLTLSGFYPGNVANPHLQRHYAVLEALALNEPPPAEIDDATLPDLETMRKFPGLFQAFKDAVYGEGYTADVETTKPEGKKRKAEVGADVVEAAGKIDFKGLAAAGHLATLTVNDLKLYCEMNSLPKGGKKADVIDRIMQHLGLVK